MNADEGQRAEHVAVQPPVAAVIDSVESAPALESESDQVFASAAELFRLLSTPIRLKIISALCTSEKNVTQLLDEIDTTQPNMSQHLSALYRAGVLGKRRRSTQIYYRIGNQRAAAVCRAVCTQIATELEPGVEPADALAPRRKVRD